MADWKRSLTDLATSINREIFVILVDCTCLEFMDLRIYPLKRDPYGLVSGRLVGVDGIGLWLEPTEWAKKVEEGEVAPEQMGHLLIPWNLIVTISSPPVRGPKVEKPAWIGLKPRKGND